MKYLISEQQQLFFSSNQQQHFYFWYFSILVFQTAAAVRYFCPTNLYRHQSAPHKIGRRISRSQNERFHLDFAPQRVEIFQHSKIWLLSPLGDWRGRVLFFHQLGTEMDLSENVKVELLVLLCSISQCLTFNEYNFATVLFCRV